MLPFLELVTNSSDFPIRIRFITESLESNPVWPEKASFDWDMSATYAVDILLVQRVIRFTSSLHSEDTF